MAALIWIFCLFLEEHLLVAGFPESLEKYSLQLEHRLNRLATAFDPTLQFLWQRIRIQILGILRITPPLF
jgi:hypothetical protein